MQNTKCEIIIACIRKIREEQVCPQDEYSRTIWVAFIEILLNYCMRFYGCLFTVRKVNSKDF